MSVQDTDESSASDARTGDATGLAGQSTAPEGGASAIEYALLLGLIAIVVLAAMALLGVNVSELYSSIATGY